jgi:hypothetical protein
MQKRAIPSEKVDTRKNNSHITLMRTGSMKDMHFNDGSIKGFKVQTLAALHHAAWCMCRFFSPALRDHVRQHGLLQHNFCISVPATVASAMSWYTYKGVLATCCTTPVSSLDGSHKVLTDIVKRNPSSTSTFFLPFIYLFLLSMQGSEEFHADLIGRLEKSWFTFYGVAMVVNSLLGLDLALLAGAPQIVNLSIGIKSTEMVLALVSTRIVLKRPSHLIMSFLAWSAVRSEYAVSSVIPS